MRIRLTFALIGLSCLTNAVFAWDATGHRLIAQIAYHRLQPMVRRKIDHISEVFRPLGTPLQRFEYMAVEPDLLRAQGDTTYAKYHFINTPYSMDGTPGKPVGPENVVNGIELAEKNVLDQKLSLKQQGQWLSYLVHFVGDSHQPLHCVVMYSKQFPDGDAGGNLYPIHYRNITELHALWDRGVGGFRLPYHRYPLSTSAINRVAAGIVKQFPPTYFGEKLQDLKPHDWAMESYLDAKDFAYTTPMHAKPSAYYMQVGSKIARQRIALAGYRLATVLNKLYS